MSITSRQQIQVLHVDDKPEITELTATLLERESDRFSVETAASADEGLQLLAESEIDCIVSDYQMPGMNGIEFLEIVAEDYPNLPFILYTGKGSEEVASDAISAGVTDYLQKENDTDDCDLLANRIVHAVNSHQREQRIQFLQTLENELTELSIEFLRTEESDIDTLIDGTLEKLGTLVGADRTYIFDIDQEAETLSNTHEWCSEGVEPQIGMLQDLPQDTLPWWMQKLENLERITVPNVSELPPEAEAEQEILQEQNIESLIATPMISNSELIGFIGFDWVEEQDAWSDEFINILRMASELITTARKRKAREQNLKESKEYIAEQNDALESFTEIVTDTERTPTQQITHLLELGTNYLNLDIGILSDVNGSEYTVRNVVDPTDTIEPGNSFNLADTYCSLVYEADGPVSFHSPVDGGVKDHPAYQKQGTESYIGVPVRVNGQRYGTLNFSQPESRPASIADAEESFVRILAQWIGAELERQQREEELERTSQFLRETQEVAQVGGWEVDLQSDTLRWSDEVYHIHGLPLDANPTPEEGIGFYHPNDRDTMKEAFDRLTTEGEPYDLELRIIRADNNDVRWVRTRGEPIYEDEEIVAVNGTFQDITERKEREQELKRSQQIIENATDIATIIDPEGEITYVSPAVEDMLGYDPEELVGNNGFRYQPEETEVGVADAIKHVLDNPAETKTVQTRFRRADDSWCWIESTLRNRVDDDVIDGILVSSRDVTERKKRKQELQRQNSRLNEFARVVSHDLRNPLNVAQSRATLLENRKDSEVQKHLSPLVDALERMERIVEDTLTLARQGETVGEMDAIRLVDLVGKCWAGVETTEATLEVEDEFTIRGDRDRVRHVFENLFRNAVEHGGDDVTVRVGQTDEDGIYVEDDGPGIPPDGGDDIFEPGHTSAAGGTGFGLAIVKRIAEAHGWGVTVTDGQDGGARFQFDGVELIAE